MVCWDGVSRKSQVCSAPRRVPSASHFPSGLYEAVLAQSWGSEIAFVSRSKAFACRDSLPTSVPVSPANKRTSQAGLVRLEGGQGQRAEVGRERHPVTLVTLCERRPRPQVDAARQRRHLAP